MKNEDSIANEKVKELQREVLRVLGSAPEKNMLFTDLDGAVREVMKTGKTYVMALKQILQDNKRD